MIWVSGELVGLDRRPRRPRVGPVALVAAGKALLAEGRAAEAEIALRHEGSTILAMRDKIGRPLGARGRACAPGGPSAPPTGSQGGDLDAEGVTLAETDEGCS